MEPNLPAESVAWNWVALLAASGLVVPALSCFVGLRQKAEIALWTLLYAAWVAAAYLVPIPAPFRTLLFAGILTGVLTATFSMIFLDSYVRKNPWYAEQTQKPRSQLAGGFYGMGVVMGGVYGAIFGAIAHFLQG